MAAFYGARTFYGVWIASSLSADLVTLQWPKIMDFAVKNGILTKPIGPDANGNYIGASGSLCKSYFSAVPFQLGRILGDFGWQIIIVICHRARSQPPRLQSR